jgi:metallo-beta-lactamase class B
MVYADSVNPISAPGFKFTNSRSYPHALDDFENSFKFFESTPCDILITAHPEFSGLFDHEDARGRGVKPDPMVDSTACRRYAESGREKLRARLASEAKQ